MDENLFRDLHMGFGALCLVSGTIALFVTKKRGKHSKAGQAFAISLLLAYFSILPNILSDQNYFMLGIGALAVFAAIDGWRALRRFKKTLAPTPSLVDYVAVGLTGLTSALLAIKGGMATAEGLEGEGLNLMALVMVAFGLFGAALIRGTVKRWKNPPSSKGWLAVHIGMMTGALSAALVAFFAIQFSGKVGSFEWTLWVGPVVLMNIIGNREMKKRNLSWTDEPDNAAPYLRKISYPIHQPLSGLDHTGRARVP